MVRCRSNRHRCPNRWKRRNCRSLRITAIKRGAKDKPGERAAEATADQSERGEAEMAEDQRPAEQRVEADAEKAEPQNDARPLERGEEVAQQVKQQPGRGAPHVGAEERLSLARQGLRFPECAHEAADMPQQQPVGRQRKDQQPQSGTKRAADVADRIEALSKRRRDHRRRGDQQAKKEHVEREGEVERERRRGELGRPKPAHQQDVGRLDCLLGDVGEDQRPGERQHRAQLGPPGAVPGETCPAGSLRRRSCRSACRKGLAATHRESASNAANRRGFAMTFLRAIWKLLVGVKDAWCCCS